MCALFGLPCTVYMGATDVARQAPNVFRMKLLGTTVVPVKSGSRTLKDAMNEALRDWVANVEDTYYLIGTVAGSASHLALALLAAHGGDGGKAFWTFALAVGVDGFAYAFASIVLITYMSTLASVEHAASQFGLLTSLCAFPGSILADQRRIVLIEKWRPDELELVGEGQFAEQADRRQRHARAGSLFSRPRFDGFMIGSDPIEPIML